MNDADRIVIAPDDAYNRALVEQVHPTGWVNPRPSGRYNLVVIGAGAAGLITAAIAAGLGAKVALIERHLMGGDCLNIGCVPSKALLRAARAWADLDRAEEFGVTPAAGGRRDFGVVMARVRKLRAAISPADSAHRYKQLGVDVFIGEGVFTANDRVEVGGQTLTFAKAAICTGGRAALPDIPGLKEAGFFTNETIFSLIALPPRMAVIGGGPIGCEMAQAFSRFGSQVSLLQDESRILPQEDEDAARFVVGAMDGPPGGVTFLCSARVVRVEGRGAAKVIYYEQAGAAREVCVDAILVATGRAPNVEGLGLDRAGVAYDHRRGVHVNTHLQTTQPRIYAAGDICSAYKFTHMADALAQIVVQNALFPHPLGLGLARADRLVVPWCTYTDPEVAHVGLNAQTAQALGMAVEAFTTPLGEVDRAVLDGNSAGFARLYVQKGTDRIVGATLVAAHAGEMIGEVTVAMRNGLGLKALGGTIHPYPTQAEAIRKAALIWRKRQLSDGAKRWLKRGFAWMR